MREAAQTWGGLLRALRQAIDDGDHEEGEALVERLQYEAARNGDLGQESSALFHEGMFADAFGELTRAEACFAESVAIDERLHGREHDAVADALNSLAIVQGRAGKHEIAAATYLRSAQIYVATQSPHRCSALVRVGQAYLTLGKDDEAEALLLSALDYPSTADAGWTKVAGTLLHQIFVPKERFLESLRVLAIVSRDPLGEGSRHREAQAGVWCDLGHLSVVFGMTTQAAAAYAYAGALSSDEVLRAEVARRLDRLDVTFGPPLDAFRVVHLQEGRAHVAHALRGLFVALEPAPTLSVGDEVRIDATRSPTVFVDTASPLAD